MRNYQKQGTIYLCAMFQRLCMVCFAGGGRPSAQTSSAVCLKGALWVVVQPLVESGRPIRLRILELILSANFKARVHILKETTKYHTGPMGKIFFQTEITGKSGNVLLMEIGQNFIKCPYE